MVIDATPGDTTDNTDGEYYGDASSIAAQGTVEYQYSKELPYSGLPDSCYFILEGDAPGASLVDTNNIDTPESGGDPAVLTGGADRRRHRPGAIKEHADVINESYGYNNVPGSYAAHYAANDAAVAAGVTVVVSSGDSGAQGTVSSPATDPLVIAAGATNTLAPESAMNYGFTGWVNNDITPLSSGGTTPNNKLVDLVAPGYGGEAACNPDGSDCPTNTHDRGVRRHQRGRSAHRRRGRRRHPGVPRLAQRGQPVAGAGQAAAHQHRHRRRRPGRPAGRRAAQHQRRRAGRAAEPNTTTAAAAPRTWSLSPTQLDLTGAGGSTNFQTVSLYNPNNARDDRDRDLSRARPAAADRVDGHRGRQRSRSALSRSRSTAPRPRRRQLPTCPPGLDRLTASMIWPDPTNSTILNFILTDPEGRLRQFSYDYGDGGSGNGAIGHRPEHPERRGGRPRSRDVDRGDQVGQRPRPPAGAAQRARHYTGTMKFQVTGQNFVTSPASSPVTIAAHRSATIPLSVAMPASPGDHPQSVQFTATDGAATSLPDRAAHADPEHRRRVRHHDHQHRRRVIGQISSFDVNVPSGQPDLGITLTTPDVSADDPMTLFLVNPSRCLGRDAHGADGDRPVERCSAHRAERRRDADADRDLSRREPGRRDVGGRRRAQPDHQRPRVHPDRGR